MLYDLLQGIIKTLLLNFSVDNNSVHEYFYIIISNP